jgi:hypothetical protein
MSILFRFRSLLVAVLICSAASVAPCYAGTVYDLTADWSDTSNPNGVWTYRGDGNALPNNVANWANETGQNAWAVSATTGFLPAWMKATAIVTNGTAINGTAIGDIVTHTYDSANGAPGYDPSNVIWTAPSAGVVDIAGKLWQARNLSGRNQHWELFVNGVDSGLGGDFTGGTATPFTKASPATFSDPGVSVFGGEVVELRITTTAGFGDFVGVGETLNFTPRTIPEPATLTLLGIGLVGICGYGWLRRRQSATA